MKVRYGLKQFKTGREWLLLAFWTVIGASLRFAGLTTKPPWTDEFATLVFSLGNNFETVPLDRVISLENLLTPLQVNPDASITDVVSLLLHEDNHPPLYFVLAHLWMKLLPHSGDYISLWAARSLPALFGMLSIPAIYCLARVSFRSPLVGQLAAAMMAVSPYGIFLAQEARHYTLAVLFVIASLGCLTVAARYLQNLTPLPLAWIFLWIAVNGLGLSVHFFFSLTLVAEAIALLLFLRHQIQHLPSKVILKAWWRLGWVALGTLTAGLVWVGMVAHRGYGNGMTDWIRNDSFSFSGIISPPFQLLATWITMLSLLPIESPSLAVMVASGLIMLLFLLWAVPILNWGLRNTWQLSKSRLPAAILLGFLGGAIALFFTLTYFFGIDITRGSRYSFVYFPAVMVLFGASLATVWQSKIPNPKIAIIAIWTVGLLSALTVCFNLGYQKYYRPDLLVPLMAKHAANPILIATTHQSLVQTGEMMGLGWELQKHPLPADTRFLLISQPARHSPQGMLTLQKQVNQLPRPLDVWTVNFDKPFDTPVKLDNCVADSQPLQFINGYGYQRYHCPKRQ